MIEDAPFRRVGSLHRRAGEEHLFDEIEGQAAHEPQQAGGVVG